MNAESAVMGPFTGCLTADGFLAALGDGHRTQT